MRIGMIARLVLLLVFAGLAYAWLTSDGTRALGRLFPAGGIGPDPFGIVRDDAEPVGELGKFDLRVLEAQRERAAELALSHAHFSLTGTLRDLDTLQTLIDRGVLEASDRFDLQSLGVALGDLMVNELGLEWVVVQDDLGRSRGLRIPRTEDFIFPVTMISKRVERGVEVDVRALFETTRERVTAARVPATPDRA
jgi:hypothetical protein